MMVALPMNAVNPGSGAVMGMGIGDAGREIFIHVEPLKIPYSLVQQATSKASRVDDGG